MRLFLPTMSRKCVVSYLLAQVRADSFDARVSMPKLTSKKTASHRFKATPTNGSRLTLSVVLADHSSKN